MGLRTASVRRPHVEVMAPALTETSQGQKFKLPPNGKLEPASFIIDCEKEKIQFNFNSKQKNNINRHSLNGEKRNLSDLVDSAKCSGLESAASDIVPSDIMNPTSMGDQGNEMGIEKTGLDISSIHKEKISNDVDQLLHSLSSSLPDAENACNVGDLRPPSVEDIMQVFKSMESSDKVNNTPNDLSSENEEIFPMPGTDLTNNLSSFEKELLENVDVMNISIEDQHEDMETVDKQKESQAKDMLKDLLSRQARNERRLDFIRRRIHKVKSRVICQHVSGEIAGVFENVHRLLKKDEPLKQDSLLTSNLLSTSIGSEYFKPMSLTSAKTLVRKLDTTVTLQSSAAAKQTKSVLRFYGSVPPEPSTFRNSISSLVKVPSWPIETKKELQKVSGQLSTQLGVVQHEVDSEATESSSGGESSDELCNYTNPHQQYLAIQKRALWKYSTERAAIATRWTWLQAQVADLEYRIRQHADLQRQIRLSKGAVQLGGTSPPYCSVAASTPPPLTPVNGYRGQLPGSSLLSKTPPTTTTTDEVSQDYQCSRTRPLVGFKKRKLVQLSGLHTSSKKTFKPSTIRCGCVSSDLCILCMGRTDPTKPREPPETLGRSERMALTDPMFHPVLSLAEDTSEHAHMEALMKIPEWQMRSNRMKTAKGLLKDSKSLEHKSKKLEHRKKYARLLKPSTMNALSAKLKNKMRGRKPGRRSHSLTRIHKKRPDKDISDPMSSVPSDIGDEEVESIGNNSNAGIRSLDSPNLSPLLQIPSISSLKRNRIHSYSYDIDNIVIPYSVAASTRVEKLQYKEILTPKWRIADPDYDSMFNKKNEAFNDFSQDSDTEDLSEEAVTSRHDRCEHEEKKRFLSYLKLPASYGRTRSHKRTDSRAESSGANTPDPMSPHNMDTQDGSMNSPMTSPPATPLSIPLEDNGTLPSIAVLRRRTISQSRYAKDREVREEVQGGAVEEVEVTPFEKRLFPIDDQTFEMMMQSMPENHQFQTNARSQDSVDMDSYTNYLDQGMDSPGTESTESAIGDGEEDPNDPEWIDMERANRDKHKR